MQETQNLTGASAYLGLLRNHIDICKVPFSDRGSRLLVLQAPGQSRLLVKLAERLTGLDPDIETYLRRPAFIRDLALIDENGVELAYELLTRPHVLYFQTRLGEFGLVFQDKRSLSFGLPPDTTAGIRFHVSPQYWHKRLAGGSFKAVRNLTYQTTGEVVRNEITPRAGGYNVEFVVGRGVDHAIVLTIHPEVADIPEAQLFSKAHAAAWKLPYAVYDEGVVSTIDRPIIGEVTKPPILAWAAMKLH